jgi:hypothetical protein
MKASLQIPRIPPFPKWFDYLMYFSLHFSATETSTVPVPATEQKIERKEQDPDPLSNGTDPRILIRIITDPEHGNRGKSVNLFLKIFKKGNTRVQ